MILNMYLEVPREVVNALAKQRNLNLRRTGISLMESELLNNLPPLLLSNCHVFSVSSFLLFVCFSITVPQRCKGEQNRQTTLNPILSKRLSQTYHFMVHSRRYAEIYRRFHYLFDFF
jgi:hypothetical protein